MKIRMFFAAALACLGATASAQWSDNFDSYATGSQLHGQGGWKGWANSSAAGALTSSLYSVSAPNSAEITGASDLVHEYAGITSGLWRYTANVYVPVAFTGTSYFILLSKYNDPGTDLHWAVQLTMNGTTNLVGDDNINGGIVTPVPLVRGQWGTITVDMDLTNDTRLVRYNGLQVSNGTWRDTTGLAPLALGGVDLFANNASPVYYDNMSVAAVPEPASLAALAVGALALLRRRRR